MKLVGRACRLWIGLMATAFVGDVVRADEGMWLFNDLPVSILKERHGFHPTDAWADSVRLASVRLNSGGSASFISPTGLVLTNHHVAADTLGKLSTADRDLFRSGFLARSHEEELAAPDLEINQLISSSDVTDEVKAAVTAGMSPENAAEARRARIAQIESREQRATGLRSDVVPLYGGNRYHVYRYRRFTDVRLVWAPEEAIAFFGGDADNFEYPRYSLDATIFRVWEDGRPAKIDTFLLLCRAGVAEGDLVFVAGHPGRTQRLLSVDALREIRDHQLPRQIDGLRRREILLQQFSLDGPEAARRARNSLFGTQNGRKARLGSLFALQSPGILEAKVVNESRLLAELGSDPVLRPLLAGWDAARVNAQARTALQKAGLPISSRLFGIAQRIVQLVAEDTKPSGERLPEYADAGREQLLLSLFSRAPLYPDLEAAVLADSLAEMIERRGADDPLCTQVLAGRSPTDRAEALIAGSKLTDVAERRRLVDAGLQAVQSSGDPLIRLAWLVDPEERRIRRLGDELAERDQQAADTMMQARFALRGTSEYPDATFTLRLAFGTIKGYRERGRDVRPFTTFAGAFAREEAHRTPAGLPEDFALPQSWHDARDRIDLATPFNFICTADIIGGNSGSPVINREGELVGLIFDGNIQSLSASYVYSDDQSRAVSVDVRAILESLEKIYAAIELLKELP